MGITSLQFDHLKQMTQKYFILEEGEDIPKYYEPTPETILQAMEYVGLDPSVL